MIAPIISPVSRSMNQLEHACGLIPSFVVTHDNTKKLKNNEGNNDENKSSANYIVLQSSDCEKDKPNCRISVLL